MKTSAYISFTINRFPKGYVFTYADFTTEVNQKEAVIKALNRMVSSGKIVKLAKGKYYKPETTPFGNLLPDQKQVVKDYWVIQKELEPVYNMEQLVVLSNLESINVMLYSSEMLRSRKNSQDYL